MDAEKTSLIAVLDGRTQAVTQLLDLLLDKGEIIDQVIAVYPGGNVRCRRTFKKLAAAFSDGAYRNRRIALRRLKIQKGERHLVEVCSPGEIEAARQTIQDLLHACKSRGERVFLSISSGQRAMVFMAACTAMRYFTTEDRIWHIDMPWPIPQESGGMEWTRPPESEVRLVEVPIVPWTVYLPGLAPLLGGTNASLQANGWLDADERARCHRVWDSITPRQRDALREIAYGRSTKQAADRMGVAPSTVASHRGAVLYACSEVWAGAEVKFDTQFLRERFRPFLVAH